MISVIIPVYNVEPYLEKCLQSVCSQTYADLQIILVNDGSPDGSPAICAAWAGKDSRIELINKENGGLSDARNAGMRCVKGDYLAFVDSDDYLEPDMFERMLEKIEETDSDICVCATNVIFQDKVRYVSSESPVEQSDGKEAVRLLMTGKISMTVWNKLYRTEIYDGLLFPKGKVYEDEYVTPFALARAKKVCYIDRPLYNYIEREGSIQRSGFSERSFHRVEAVRYQYDHFRKEQPELRPVLINKYYTTALDVFFEAKRAGSAEDIHKAYGFLRDAAKLLYPLSDAGQKLRLLPVLLGEKTALLRFRTKE